MQWENLTLKGALAFFLVCVAALMVFFWMIRPPSADANALALLAGFVMMFIKMAADAVGYQYNSSAGSDKKDETQAKVNVALADKVAPTAVVVPPAAPTAPATPWWSLLTDQEKSDITAAAANDPRAAAFIATSSAGHGSADDLTYLVMRALLTQARATTIQGA